MPELPEVEVLVRHLRPLLRGKKIRDVQIRRERVIRPTPANKLKTVLRGATFEEVRRRGKFLLFQLRGPVQANSVLLVGHLGMTGRMFLARKSEPLPKHAAVVLDLGRERFIYEDQRYFGKLSLDASSIARMGPEPLADDFTAAKFAAALAGSKRAIKVRLLDQDLVAGVGNIYASEALHRARIKPQLAANGLGSRRDCEELITSGRVEIDRKVVTELGTRVDPEQQDPSLPQGHPFRNIRSGIYWTATPHPTDDIVAWQQSFFSGQAVTDQKSGTRRLWCVLGPGSR